MELSELTVYASEKYHIEEQHKWTDFPGFSVLCHPESGKWIALLMRQWDTDTGTFIERCDLKCGIQCLREYDKSYLSFPARMKGSKWIGAAFDDRTEPEVIFYLFDRAFAGEEPHGATIILESKPVFQDTKIPFPDSAHVPQREVIPEKMRQMRRMFEYGRVSLDAKAWNFYRQGIFMKDYEDDVPWTVDFVCYFPTYHDLTTRQLRSYFTWRTRVRRGDYRPVTLSAAYIYLYELLNGIGVSSAEESLEKMKDFEKEFLDKGFGDDRMRQNLRRWMLEFAVVENLPSQIAAQSADVQLIERDRALMFLKNPEEHSDEEVFLALCQFDRKKTEKSPVVAKDPERGRHLFCEAWRRAAKNARFQGLDLFSQCFGKPSRRRWYPFSNAVYYWRENGENREYCLNEVRTYLCRGGVWQMEAYEKLSFDRSIFQGFMHEADLLLRRYLKTGRYLREKPEDAWARPYIQFVIEADREALIEASRPKITIDLSGLEQIRKDALITQNSLLAAEETVWQEQLSDQPSDADEESGQTDAARELQKIDANRELQETDANREPEEPLPDIRLDAVHIRILKTILQGDSAAGIIRENHLMPSIAADTINEALFDEIGDTVLFCEDDELFLVEDYTEDLIQLFGGMMHE